MNQPGQELLANCDCLFNVRTRGHLAPASIRTHGSSGSPNTITKIHVRQAALVVAVLFHVAFSSRLASPPSTFHTNIVILTFIVPHDILITVAIIMKL